MESSQEVISIIYIYICIEAHSDENPAQTKNLYTQQSLVSSFAIIFFHYHYYHHHYHSSVCMHVLNSFIISISIYTSNLSHVFVPSPHGDFRVVKCNVFVGIRTGPFTLSRLSFAPRIKSAHTFSKFCTLRDVSVIRMR